MPFYKRDDVIEAKITTMEETIKSGKFEKSYIRELVANQKGELSVNSRYYKGNIAEGNWSLLEKDLKIKELDEEIVDAEDILLGLYKHPREKDAEYEYVFIPSYYAVKTLILYYIENQKQAESIYGLKNAVVRREDKKFYGGLPFILKYMGGDFEDSRIDFKGIMEILLDFESRLESDNENKFLNDIIDCINDFYGVNLILERRIKNFKEAKENWFCIDFYEEIKKEKDFLLNYKIVDGYKILMHNDVKKDWKHLQKGQVKKVKEKISKIPQHPYNDSLEDSEPLQGDLKGWFSQRISKKDRLVYKIEPDKKIVYIATVCGHYDKAPRRLKSMASYS